MATTWRHGDEPPRPDAVGILALDVYFPTQHVLMSDLEEADGCPGKYTLGLGQEAMSFCNDREDVVSMALTVTQSLLEKYGVRPEEVGHIQVGTESGVDRSKSIKSHLMTLFEPGQQQKQQQQQQQEENHKGQTGAEGQPPVRSCNSKSGAGINGRVGVNGGGRRQVGTGIPAEGVDCVHACYGGTAALLAAVAWVESRRWDGRLALVVAADMALYAPGTAARPTGGCGAAAILVGPDAPLVLDPLWYGNHAEHSWDFYKPHGTLPYPAVDGPQTLVQYLSAAGRCAVGLVNRLQAAGELAPGEGLLPQVQHYIAHAPFNKLARKGLSRVALLDALRIISTAKADEQKQQLSENVDATGAAEGGAQRASGQEQPPHHDWVQEWVQQEVEAQRVTGRQQVQAAGSELRTATETADAGKSVPTTDMVTAKRGPELHDGAVQGTAAAAGAVGSANGAGSGGKCTSSTCAGAPRAKGLCHQACYLAPEGPAATAAVWERDAPDDCAARGRQKYVVGSNASMEAGEKPAATAPAATSEFSRPLTSVEYLVRGILGGIDAAAAASRVLSVSDGESAAVWRLDDKALEAQLLAATANEWSERAEDGAWLQKQVGNSYTACVWQGLASLVWRRGPQLAGRRILLFSFGSGTIASLFSLVPRGCGSATARTTTAPGEAPTSQPGAAGGVGGYLAQSIVTGFVATNEDANCGKEDADCGVSDPRFTLEAMQHALNLDERLRTRVRRPLETFDKVSEQVASSYRCPVPYEPHGDASDVATGSYYLVRVDEHSRRLYERKA